MNKELFKNLMIRHTFGNPRELVYLLVSLGEKVKTNIEEDIDFSTQDYAYFIDEKANAIIFDEHFSTECLPSFPHEQLLDFLIEIRKNYFSLIDIPETYHLLIKILFRFGLIGIVEKNKKNDTFTQFFERGSNYPEENLKFRNSEIYLTHPCLDYLLADINDDFYYPYCIIGHNRPFIFKRALEYYMPRNIPKQGNCETQIINKFQLFYNSEFAISSFNNIPNRIKAAYTALLLSASSKKEEIKALDKYISNQISEGILSCSRDDDIILLERNIKIRIIFALGVFLDVYKHGSQVYKFFIEINPRDPSQTIYNVSFTQNCFTKHRVISKEKVAAYLSDFEWSVIKDFCSSNEVKNFIKTSTPIRKKALEEKVMHLKEITQNIKFE